MGRVCGVVGVVLLLALQCKAKSGTPPVPCSSRGRTACREDDKCVWDAIEWGKCVDDPCLSHTSATDCPATCEWRKDAASDEDGLCRSPCQLHGTDGACRADTRCVWEGSWTDGVGECIEDVCARFTQETTCPKSGLCTGVKCSHKCTWDAAAGTGGQCRSSCPLLEEGACHTDTGCHWAVPAAGEPRCAAGGAAKLCLAYRGAACPPVVCEFNSTENLCVSMCRRLDGSPTECAAARHTDPTGVVVTCGYDEATQTCDQKTPHLTAECSALSDSRQCSVFGSGCWWHGDKCIPSCEGKAVDEDGCKWCGWDPAGNGGQGSCGRTVCEMHVNNSACNAVKGCEWASSYFFCRSACSDLQPPHCGEACVPGTTSKNHGTCIDKKYIPPTTPATPAPPTAAPSTTSPATAVPPTYTPAVVVVEPASEVVCWLNTQAQCLFTDDCLWEKDLWDGTWGCVSRRCSNHNEDKGACLAEPTCVWNPLQRCFEDPCLMHTSATDCPATCDWRKDATPQRGLCLSPCKLHSTDGACRADTRCVWAGSWTDGVGECIEDSCAGYAEAACPRHCTWDAAAGNGGQCRSSCPLLEEDACRTNSECHWAVPLTGEPRCAKGGAAAWCPYYVDYSCPPVVCEFNSTENLCVSMCRRLDGSPTECAAARHTDPTGVVVTCGYDEATQACDQKTPHLTAECSALSDSWKCDEFGSHCWWSNDERCVPSCAERQSDEDGCKSCGWDPAGNGGQGSCGRTVCEMHVNTSACNAVTGCAWGGSSCKSACSDLQPPHCGEACVPGTTSKNNRTCIDKKYIPSTAAPATPAPPTAAPSTTSPATAVPPTYTPAVVVVEPASEVVCWLNTQAQCLFTDDCLWDRAWDCVSRRCSNHNEDKGACLAEPTCVWNPLQRCFEDPCLMHTSATDCPATCDWRKDATPQRGLCLSPCKLHSTDGACRADTRCVWAGSWTGGVGECIEDICAGYAEAACPHHCTWDAAAGTGGQCRSSCPLLEEDACHTDTGCHWAVPATGEPRCAPGGAAAWCPVYGDINCPSVVCEFNLTADMCVSMCRRLDGSPTECAAARHTDPTGVVVTCGYDEATQTCDQRTPHLTADCSALSDTWECYEWGSRCGSRSGEGCVPSCADKPADEHGCRSCGWDPAGNGGQGSCGRTVCEMHVNTSACNAVKGCAWGGSNCKSACSDLQPPHCGEACVPGTTSKNNGTCIDKKYIPSTAAPATPAPPTAAPSTTSPATAVPPTYTPAVVVVEPASEVVCWLNTHSQCLFTDDCLWDRTWDCVSRRCSNHNEDKGACLAEPTCVWNPLQRCFEDPCLMHTSATDCPATCDWRKDATPQRGLCLSPCKLHSTDGVCRADTRCMWAGSWTGGVGECIEDTCAGPTEADCLRTASAYHCTWDAAAGNGGQCRSSCPLLEEDACRTNSECHWAVPLTGEPRCAKGGAAAWCPYYVDYSCPPVVCEFNSTENLCVSMCRRLDGSPTECAAARHTDPTGVVVTCGYDEATQTCDQKTPHLTAECSALSDSWKCDEFGSHCWWSNDEGCVPSCAERQADEDGCRSCGWDPAGNGGQGSCGRTVCEMHVNTSACNAVKGCAWGGSNCKSACSDLQPPHCGEACVPGTTSKNNGTCIDKKYIPSTAAPATPAPPTAAPSTTSPATAVPLPDTRAPPAPDTVHPPSTSPVHTGAPATGVPGSEPPVTRASVPVTDSPGTRVPLTSTPGTIAPESAVGTATPVPSSRSPLPSDVPSTAHPPTAVPTPSAHPQEGKATVAPVPKSSTPATHGPHTDAPPAVLPGAHGRDTPVPTPQDNSSSGLPWWVWLLVVSGLVLLVLSAVAAVLVWTQHRSPEALDLEVDSEVALMQFIETDGTEPSPEMQGTV